MTNPIYSDVIEIDQRFAFVTEQGRQAVLACKHPKSAIRRAFERNAPAGTIKVESFRNKWNIISAADEKTDALKWLICNPANRYKLPRIRRSVKKSNETANLGKFFDEPDLQSLLS